MQALIRHNLSSPSATAGVRDRMLAPTFNSRAESVCRNLDAADVCGAPEPLAAHVPSEKIVSGESWSLSLSGHR